MADAENYAEIFYFRRIQKTTMIFFAGNSAADIYSAEKFAEKMAELEVGAVNNADSLYLVDQSADDFVVYFCYLPVSVSAGSIYFVREIDLIFVDDGDLNEFSLRNENNYLRPRPPDQGGRFLGLSN